MSFRKLRPMRDNSDIQIVPFQPRFKAAFKELNIAWIEKHWEMEPDDYKALDNPTDNILNKGGYIAFALHNDRPIGTCALIKMDDGGFELAKMGVEEQSKGLGVGLLLAQHVIHIAKELGANRLYLESNTILVPAINLYKKLGFQTVSGIDSPYQRCNIQMELKIES